MLASGQLLHWRSSVAPAPAGKVLPNTLSPLGARRVSFATAKLNNSFATAKLNNSFATAKLNNSFATAKLNNSVATKDVSRPYGRFSTGETVSPSGAQRVSVVTTTRNRTLHNGAPSRQLLHWRNGHLIPFGHQVKWVRYMLERFTTCLNEKSGRNYFSLKTDHEKNQNS